MRKFELPPMNIQRPRIIEHHAIPIRGPRRGGKYFDTWEEAHAALLERAHKRVTVCERTLVEARQFIVKVEAMRKGGK
ncbi:hypothetical protein CFN79_15060 [Chromobacterium vaccinii]|uniref:hypothetical protein n=1 Tax=Chromobacterium vaccinii TaxID=1108595 RepID=UPI000CE975BD|nr:hypothetical protein [Chromobacterium vaccinii]AVG17066.1 hypothetical protein CFN79_15060 [Chromobacterium vaccinii]